MGAAAGQRRSDRYGPRGGDEHNARNGQPATPVHQIGLALRMFDAFSRTTSIRGRVGHRACLVPRP
jgi:hypothetical protein